MLEPLNQIKEKIDGGENHVNNDSIRSILTYIMLTSGGGLTIIWLSCQTVSFQPLLNTKKSLTLTEDTVSFI